MVGQKINHGDGSKNPTATIPNVLQTYRKSRHDEVLSIKNKAQNGTKHLNRKWWMILPTFQSLYCPSLFREQASSVGCCQPPQRSSHFYSQLWRSLSPSFPSFDGSKVSLQQGNSPRCQKSVPPGWWLKVVDLLPNFWPNRALISTKNLWTHRPPKIAASEGLSQSSWLPGT